jgi:hypothetical protein
MRKKDNLMTNTLARANFQLQRLTRVSPLKRIETPSNKTSVCVGCEVAKEQKLAENERIAFFFTLNPASPSGH